MVEVLATAKRLKHGCKRQKVRGFLYLTSTFFLSHSKQLIDQFWYGASNLCLQIVCKQKGPTFVSLFSTFQSCAQDWNRTSTFLRTADFECV